MNKNTNWKKIEVIFEFLVFGIIIGVAEDLIVFGVATGEPITLKIFGIIVLIAIPFAFVGEVVADQIDFIKILKYFFEKKDTSNESDPR